MQLVLEVGVCDVGGDPNLSLDVESKSAHAFSVLLNYRLALLFAFRVVVDVAAVFQEAVVS